MADVVRTVRPIDHDREARLLEGAGLLAVSRRIARTRRIFLMQVGALVALLVAWQLASGRWIDSLFFSDPISIAEALVRIIANGTLWWNLQMTLIELVLGYVVGVAAGIGTAVVLSTIPFARPIVRPLMMMAFATPKVALAPLIIVWFGIGLLPKVILGASLVFFIVYFNTLAGIASASASMVAVVRLMQASRWDIFRKVVLPNAIPHIVTGMRITLPAALIGAIIGEFVSSNRGIGYMIAAASSRYDTAEVFAGILSLLVFILCLNALVTFFENSLLKWRPAVQDGLR